MSDAMGRPPLADVLRVSLSLVVFVGLGGGETNVVGRKSSCPLFSTLLHASPRSLSSLARYPSFPESDGPDRFQSVLHTYLSASSLQAAGKSPCRLLSILAMLSGKGQ